MKNANDILRKQNRSFELIRDIFGAVASITAALCLIGTIGYIGYSVYSFFSDQREATPEELTFIIKETPCAASAFRDGLSDGPLSIYKAKKLAADCTQAIEGEKESLKQNESRLDAVNRQRAAIDKAVY